MLKEIHALDSLVAIYDVMPPVYANYLMGIFSAVIDNVPLTAALLKSGIDMSPGEWMGLTYAVGVGGSLLVIGSAAGIVAMSKIEGLTFAGVPEVRVTPSGRVHSGLCRGHSAWLCDEWLTSKACEVPPRRHWLSHRQKLT